MEAAAISSFRYNSPMKTLPVHAVVPDIRHALDTHNRIVLQAPPGAGKTTAVPLALLDAPWLGEEKQIVMLEPQIGRAHV